MFSLPVLLFMTLFTVALAHRYEWFSTRVYNTLCPLLIRVEKKIHIFVVKNFQPWFIEEGLCCYCYWEEMCPSNLVLPRPFQGNKGALLSDMAA